MTRLRGWLIANIAVLTGAIVAGAHVGRAYGAGWGVVAGLVFAVAGIVTLAGVLAWRALKDEGIMK